MLIFLYSLLGTIILTSLGSIFTRNNKENFSEYSTNLIFGIIIISFISLFINFFLPLNKIINTIVLIIPIIIVFRNLKYYSSINHIKFLLIISSLVFLLIAKSTVYRPDAYLYHLPFINIINDHKIIFGLSNIHFRFGHISIIQYTSAIFNNFIFLKNGILLPSALIAAGIIVNFSYQLYKYLKNKEFNFHFYYLFFIIIFIAYKMNRYGEYGNDAPTHFLFFYLVSEIIKNIEYKSSTFSNLLLISIFIIMNKITMAFSIFLPFLMYKISFKKFFEYKNYFAFFFIFLWISKNIITTGCLAYPISSLCFKNITWSNIEFTNKVSIENEAWAKGWSDSKENINQDEFSKNFNWISTWKNNHFKKIYEIMFPYIILILLIFLYFKFKTQKIEKKINFKKYLIILTICVVSVLIWFLKVPVFRYGYSYFVCFLAIILSYFLLGFDASKETKLFKSLLIIFLVIFVGKNSLRIVDQKNNNPIWPKTVLQEREKLKEIKLKYITYYESIAECGFGHSICTNYKNLSLASNKKFNYIIVKNTN